MEEPTVNDRYIAALLANADRYIRSNEGRSNTRVSLVGDLAAALRHVLDLGQPALGPDPSVIGELTAADRLRTVTAEGAPLLGRLSEEPARVMTGRLSHIEHGFLGTKLWLYRADDPIERVLLPSTTAVTFDAP